MAKQLIFRLEQFRLNVKKLHLKFSFFYYMGNAQILFHGDINDFTYGIYFGRNFER